MKFGFYKELSGYLVDKRWLLWYTVDIIGLGKIVLPRWNLKLNRSEVAIRFRQHRIERMK